MAMAGPVLGVLVVVAVIIGIVMMSERAMSFPPDGGRTR
jgi:hypothetical protein